MFWVVRHSSSSEALTIFAASGLHTHVVTGCSQVWEGLDYGRSPHAYVNLLLLLLQLYNSLWVLACSIISFHCFLSCTFCFQFFTPILPRWFLTSSSHLNAYVNQRLQIQLELLMMRGVLLETCWAFNERWNNKFCYKVASCWLFLLNHTTMHGSRNIKLKD